MIPEIFAHRSIRNYLSKPIPEEVLQRVLEAGIRASNTGNMQLYSLIVTTSPEIRAELAPCHFNQPMVTQAPALITFCADIHRFSQWCRQRQAEPQYDNFLWFVNGVIDSILASQNIVLAAEHEGLGICYLGTTTYNAPEIAKVLQLPQGVIPVTTITLGYPDPEKMPPLTDRLPLEGVVHRERTTTLPNRLTRSGRNAKPRKRLLGCLPQMNCPIWLASLQKDVIQERTTYLCRANTSRHLNNKDFLINKQS